MPTIAEVRAKYPQYDDLSDVQLAGALHDRFYSDMPADVFAEKIGLTPPDPVSVNSVVRSAATGVPLLGGLMNKANAATNAALAPIVEPFLTPSENDISRNGETFGQRYDKSLEMQNAADAKFADQHPYVDTGAKLAGATAAMVPAVAAAPGLFGATGGLGARIVGGGVSNAALGGTDAAIRGQDPTGAALIGGALGAGFPVAAAALHGIASPFISNIMARMDPEGYARRQVARAFTESGRPVSDVVGDVVQAGHEGQGVYTVADALGNSGQRMLSSVARAPGEGRTEAVNALEARQGMQGRRVSNALSEGFGSRMTPEELRNSMTAERGAVADEAYGAVRNDAGPVDVRGVVDHIDTLVPPEPAAPDTISGRLQRYARMLTNGDEENPQFLTDFEHVQRVRSELADEIQNARQAGQGNRARVLNQVLTHLDDALETSSEGFRQANRDFARASRNIDAIDQGRIAATRGRTEDTIPAYQALSPRGQQAFRTGYVDPLIEKTQGAAFGVNKARPLLNDAFTAEAEAMAPGNPLMQRRLAREQRMSETRNQALGGSKTADNLADADALGIDPSVVGHVLSGNYGAVARSLIAAGSNAVTGNTPAVRQAVGNLLLRNGANVTATNFEQMITDTVQRIQAAQRAARNAARSAAGAAAVTTTSAQKPSIFPKRKAAR